MHFKAGDHVVHPAHGLGQIAKLEEKQFFGGEARVYYEVVLPKCTVWVPIETSGTTALRMVTTKHDLARYRHLLKDRPAILNQDHRKRQLEITDRLKQGSFQVLCEVVRDLTARSWRKPAGEADSSLLRKARENLCQEWAASLGISVEDATREIEGLLSEARQAYQL